MAFRSASLYKLAGTAALLCAMTLLIAQSGKPGKQDAIKEADEAFRAG